jgi:hypothetical protein
MRRMFISRPTSSAVRPANWPSNVRSARCRTSRKSRCTPSTLPLPWICKPRNVAGTIPSNQDSGVCRRLTSRARVRVMAVRIGSAARSSCAIACAASFVVAVACGRCAGAAGALVAAAGDDAAARYETSARGVRPLSSAARGWFPVTNHCLRMRTFLRHRFADVSPSTSAIASSTSCSGTLPFPCVASSVARRALSRTRRFSTPSHCFMSHDLPWLDTASNRKVNDISLFSPSSSQYDRARSSRLRTWRTWMR